MFRATINLQLGEQSPSQAIFRKHSPHRHLYQTLRFFLKYFCCTSGPDPTGVTGMAMVQFGVDFGTGQPYLRSVDDDDEITRILMRREIGPVFASQHYGST